MKLEKWALIAEVISGVAVVVTLIFLILGINENTRATYAGTYQLLLSEINDISLVVQQNDALSIARSRFEETGWEGLDELDTFRVRNAERSNFRVYESAYYAYGHGTLDDAEWGRFARVLCRRRSLHSDEQWKMIEFVLSDEFREFIRSSCHDYR